MESLKLEQLIEQQIKNLEKGVIDKRVISYKDYKNKYTFIKPAVYINVELTSGITAVIDVTDYFEKVMKGVK